jgi:hypothetical protein
METKSLLYPPLTKVAIKYSLQRYLYSAVLDDFQNRIDEIIEQNTILGKYNSKHLFYKGNYYFGNGPVLWASVRKYNKLVPDLKDKMEQYLKDKKEFEEEEHYVLGFFNQVLNASTKLEDYLKIFPECLHSALKKMFAPFPEYPGSLEDSVIAEIIKKNKKPISLIKQRMVLNLLR